MSQKHSELPWIAADTFLNNAPNKTYLRQKRYGGDVIADLGETATLNRANRDFIVLAVNHHAKLVESLEILLAAIDSGRGVSRGVLEKCAEVLVLIAAAKTPELMPHELLKALAGE